MDKRHLERLSHYVEEIRSLKENIITNILLVGQVPAPTFKEKRRSRVFLDRLAELQVDECTTDGYRNPVGIIRGTSPAKPPIFIVAHLDTIFDKKVDHNFNVERKTITGPGIYDNSVGVGALLSLPEIFRRLDLTFNSDIVLAGVIQSIGKGNLRGIRHLVKTWPSPIRGAICIEGSELGRLSYFSEGMIRCEVNCNIATLDDWEHKYRPNAILVLNEVINRILRLRLPQRPRCRVVIGMISGGFKHGAIAYNATLGFEIQGDSGKIVKKIYNDIKDIIDDTGREHEMEIALKTISNLNAARLRYNHPLVKRTVEVMEALDLKPISGSSESELSIFLSRNIPAVTLGITRGENFHQINARIEIEPVFKGIAQVIGVVQAIDSGVCDE